MKKILLSICLATNMFVQSETYEVKMFNQGTEGYMVFEPSVLKILPGDSVTFIATDAAHNSASIVGMIPEGAKSWNGQLSKDITVTFDLEGIYAYQCTPHAMMAMVGIIEVGNNKNNLEKIKSVANKTKSIFVMNKDRLDKYISSL
ncbi:MAG: pseudoazurin [Proteobacteria bacterium]|jgi:pseudoazurin|nr:pseudoazurin [Pseudomonadota bacterium]